MAGDLDKDFNLTVEEYIEIREEVQLYLQSKEHKESPSSYDQLNSVHKRVVSDHANLLYKRAEMLEPEISSDLESLLEPNISSFISFDHRLKSIDGLRRKIIADSKDYGGSYYRAAHNICDSVRYTILIDEELYTQKVDEYLHRLESMGYEVIDLKNKWGKPLYQGINVRIVCKNKEDIFELQFHTPFGYQIKEGSTRDLYEVVRDLNAPKELASKADKLRRVFQSRVKPPVGAIDYDFVPEMKRR